MTLSFVIGVTVTFVTRSFDLAITVAARLLLLSGVANTRLDNNSSLIRLLVDLVTMIAGSDVDDDTDADADDTATGRFNEVKGIVD